MIIQQKTKEKYITNYFNKSDVSKTPKFSRRGGGPKTNRLPTIDCPVKNCNERRFGVKGFYKKYHLKRHLADPNGCHALGQEQEISPPAAEALLTDVSNEKAVRKWCGFCKMYKTRLPAHIKNYHRNNSKAYKWYSPPQSRVDGLGPVIRSFDSHYSMLDSKDNHDVYDEIDQIGTPSEREEKQNRKNTSYVLSSSEKKIIKTPLRDGHSKEFKQTEKLDSIETSSNRSHLLSDKNFKEMRKLSNGKCWEYINEQIHINPKERLPVKSDDYNYTESIEFLTNGSDKRLFSINAGCSLIEECKNTNKCLKDAGRFCKTCDKTHRKPYRIFRKALIEKGEKTLIEDDNQSIVTRCFILGQKSLYPSDVWYFLQIGLAEKKC